MRFPCVEAVDDTRERFPDVEVSGDADTVVELLLLLLLVVEAVEVEMLGDVSATARVAAVTRADRWSEEMRRIREAKKKLQRFL